jgi:hypothetical protein
MISDNEPAWLHLSRQQQKYWVSASTGDARQHREAHTGKSKDSETTLQGPEYKPGAPMSIPGWLMLPELEGQAGHRREDAVECYLMAGQEIEVEQCTNGRWELGRGRAIWRQESGQPVQAELAKIHL